MRIELGEDDVASQLSLTPSKRQHQCRLCDCVALFVMPSCLQNGLILRYLTARGKITLKFRVNIHITRVIIPIDFDHLDFVDLALRSG